MKPDRPLIGSVLLLAAGLALIFAYCHGSTNMSAAYPFAGSTLRVEFTTVGPAVLGGVACTAIGVLLLVWAFIAAIVNQIVLMTASDRPTERLLE